MLMLFLYLHSHCPQKKKKKDCASVCSVEDKEVFAEAFGYIHMEQQMDGWTDGICN